MIERTELAPGYPVCRVINGLWQLSRGHREDGLESAAAIRDLLRLVDAGFTTFDCADIYLGVEELLASMMRELKRTRPNPADVQIHTKYVPDRSALATLSKHDVIGAVDGSLARLGTERLDLVQLHWWDYDQPGCIDVAGWLTELIDRGKIRHLGTTNFDTRHLSRIVEAGIPIATNQAQYSLLDRRAAGAMADLCRRSKIRLLCYGVLAGGFLTDSYLGSPEPRPPMPNRSLTKYKLIIDEFGGWALHQELLEALAAIAHKYDSSIPMIAARWVLDRGAVGAVMIGVDLDDHARDNSGVFDLQLDQDDNDRIEAILERASGPCGEPFELEREPESDHARIMWTDLNADRDG